MITVIPGVEISATDPKGEVHILCYYMDFLSPGFQQFLEGPRSSRSGRIVEMCERLVSCGVHISPDEVFEEAGGIEAVGRPHLAKVMLKKKYVSSMEEAFERFLAEGTPGYVKRSKNTVDNTLEVLHAHHGISVIAHPGLIKDQGIISDLVAKGVMGIEVYCHDHDQRMVDRYLQIAHEANLLVTGGSDYHGDMLEKPFRLGDLKVPPTCHEALQQAAQRIGSGLNRRPQTVIG
jgi:predicted metal-dependent phosphoesterase TrpH